MLRLRPTFEEIEREARTRRLKILPERERRTQQGILLHDVNFDDFDLEKYNKKTLILNDNPDKGTQTDIFNETPSIIESIKTPEEEEVKQIQTEYSEDTIQSDEKEQERDREKAQNKSVMRRVYDAMFGEDEFEEEREELRNRREQIDTDEEQIIVEPEASLRSQESDNSLPMNVKKSYEPSSSSSSSSSRRSSNKSVLMPVAEDALSEYINSSPVETVQSSVPSNRTIEYVEEPTPPQSVVSSRRSQETIEYIRSRSSRGSSRSISN